MLAINGLSIRSSAHKALYEPMNEKVRWTGDPKFVHFSRHSYR